jgi:alkylation response protein AidB-like acyl-CoA dehydrogenase
MTITERRTQSAEDVLAEVRRLAPTISARAGEMEAARRMPADVLDELKRAGCFRMFMPRSHGGVGADAPATLRMFEALARADGSVGWTVMIGAGAWCDLASLPRATFDAIFGPERARPSSDVIVAGAFNPGGTLTPVDGGYRVNGRWGFASGCEHADWIYGNCIEGIVDGVPQLRVAVLRPEDVVIEDTWYTSGMRGTGSQHFRCEDVFVPADQTFIPLSDDACIDDPAVRIPLPSLFSLAIASVATGIAQGALDEIAALASTKVPMLAHGSLASSPLYHVELATAVTELRAARELRDRTARDVWARAHDAEPFSLEQRAEARATAIWVVARAAAVVDFAYHAGGGTALYESSPLQRRMRDIHTLTQHFLVRPDTLATAGAIFAGQDVEVMVF